MQRLRKLVINSAYGGFYLSDTDVELLRMRGAKLPEYPNDIRRDDPFLIELVEERLKEGKEHPQWIEEFYLRVVEIPEDVQWVIQEYDGLEWISEKHRTWYAKR